MSAHIFTNFGGILWGPQELNGLTFFIVKFIYSLVSCETEYNSVVLSCLLERILEGFSRNLSKIKLAVSDSKLRPERLPRETGEAPMVASIILM